MVSAMTNQSSPRGIMKSGFGQRYSMVGCTSAYRALPEEMNLRTFPELAARFGVPAGLGHATRGAVPVAAVALAGACIIKNISRCRARSMPGLDSAFSLEPVEFKVMVDAVRPAEKALCAMLILGCARRKKAAESSEERSLSLPM